MANILFIRRNYNYWKNNELDLSDICTPHMIPVSSKIISAWDFCFKMKYLDFRKRIRDIARTTFDKIPFDDIFEYIDYDRYNALPEGTTVIPIDEDDWLYSSLLDHINTVPKEYSRILWDHKKNIHSYSPKKFNKKIYILSCAYAVRSPVGINEVLWHLHFKKNSNVFHIKKELAFRLTNPSSQTLLYDLVRYNISFLQLIGDMKRDIDLFVYPEEFSEQGEKYKDLVKEWIDSLKVKRYG